MANQSSQVGLGLVSIEEGRRQFLNKREDVENIPWLPSSVGRLNDDVIAEILVLLPIKSLVRFRCVCKSWHALICSNQYFAKKFEAKGSYKILETVNPIKSKDLRDSRVGKTILEKQSYQVLGSSNGLVCIEDIDEGFIWTKTQEDRQLILLNPSTQDKYKLPKHTISSYFFYGFAYDSALEDYKVVLGHHSSDGYATIEVFSLKTEAWKMTTHENVKECSGQGTLLGGNLHWFSSTEPYKKTKFSIDTIIYFNVTEEKFGQFMPPPFIHPVPQTIGIGTTIGNCRLFLFEYDCFRWRSDGIAITIWVMEEYGMSESWTRHVEIPSLSLSHYKSYRYVPYWILEDGKVLMERWGERSNTIQLVCYNPEDNSQTSYSRFVHVANTSPVLYLETLVSPKPVHPLEPSPLWVRPWKKICKETTDNSTCQDLENIVELPEAPVESEGLSTLCRICDDRPCENEAEHKDEHFELRKHCTTCYEDDHWDEDCPYE